VLKQLLLMLLLLEDLMMTPHLCNRCSSLKKLMMCQTIGCPRCSCHCMMQVTALPLFQALLLHQLRITI
jgi:hypothetical protein